MSFYTFRHCNLLSSSYWIISFFVLISSSWMSDDTTSHAFLTPNTYQPYHHHHHHHHLQNTNFGRHEQQQQQCRYLTLLSSSSSSSSGTENNDINNQEEEEEGIRLNKVFKETHSRRQADTLITAGRVSVNGKPVVNRGGFKVIPYVDTVELDGVIVKGWEEMNGCFQTNKKSSPKEGGGGKNKKKKESSGTTMIDNLDYFDYVKYWKPKGVICTTDRSVKHNIIDEIINVDGFKPKHRVYPVGRLDKDTSGLILLTSNGKLPNSALRGKFKQPKTYQVFVNRPFTKQHIQQLRDGIVITTVAQRDNKKAEPLTAKTRSCEVIQIDTYGVQMTLVEGRNRQIRKMMEALDLRVEELHRMHFMGLNLHPLERPGDWVHLDAKEMNVVKNVLCHANDGDGESDDDDGNLL
mmetsp:Transcript_7176/g.10511  ORF Transcript_7176/g.10511 Transcript_7176/m.10511 type:complete len:408 (+) Transcript_7176:728-1951(+)